MIHQDLIDMYILDVQTFFYHISNPTSKKDKIKNYLFKIVLMNS